MAIVNAKEFSVKTGYPLAMIRAFCREGRLSHWQRGKVYLLDEEEAQAEMQKLKATKVLKKHSVSKMKINRKLLASGSDTFDYREAIKQMQKDCKKLE